ncbi:hypothetical protein TrST_g3254 [Triparma strigata]|uniref:Cyclic nucleotide-binding domain-containing protein n=2 Tax=Triparma TaxID=722752 RepID=A0A9W7BWQ6_9STRA|nr:hypothetical protein TrST_g3254 [Triparma strigata]
MILRDEPNWFEPEPDGMEDLKDVFVAAAESTKDAADDFVREISKGMGPMVQYLPRRIPAWITSVSAGTSSWVKPLAAQFPQCIRLFSFMGKDLLFLHSMAALAGAATIGYNMFVRSPIVGRKVVVFPVTWNGIFMGINLWQVRRLMKERRPIDFSIEELDCYEEFFQGRMLAREFHALLRDCEGEFKTVQEGTKLCEQGGRLTDLMFITDGTCEVQINRNDIGEIKPSSFVGEMSFLELLDDETGVHRPKWLPSFVPNFSPTFSNFFGAYATATVTTSRTTRILTWKQSKLIKFMEENTQFANSFEAMLAADLVKKLKATAGRREGRRLVIPSGQRGLSRKRMKQAREGGAIRRRGIAKIWIRDALRRPLDGFHRFSRRGRGIEAKPA